MPVPGIRPELPLRAKVRIGGTVQDTRRDGSKYTRATHHEYFSCPDAEFVRLAGDKPKTLTIVFPYKEWTRCWSSGLEKWGRTREGNRPILLCYTKGDGEAHGLGATIEGERHVKLDPSKPRQAIPCPASDCNFYGKGDKQGCRPQARLSFQLPGGPRDSVFRWETKGLDSIEQIEAVLEQYPDLRGIQFELSVRTERRGNKHFPIVQIRELGGSFAEPPAPDETDWRLRCKMLLVELGQWPPSEAVSDWIKEHGYEQAAKALEKKAASA